MTTVGVSRWRVGGIAAYHSDAGRNLACQRSSTIRSSPCDPRGSALHLVMIHLGACHCEAIGFAYETALAPESWVVRACGCRFCRAHGAATTSDPQGAMELVCRDAEMLVRYRFGLRTADFWLCRGCGVYLGAVTSDGGFGIINTHALVERPAQLPLPQARSYDGETAEERIARRQQRWTPVRAVTA